MVFICLPCQGSLCIPFFPKEWLAIFHPSHFCICIKTDVQPRLDVFVSAQANRTMRKRNSNATLFVAVPKKPVDQEGSLMQSMWLYVLLDRRPPLGRTRRKKLQITITKAERLLCMFPQKSPFHVVALSARASQLFSSILPLASWKGHILCYSYGPKSSQKLF